MSDSPVLVKRLPQSLMSVREDVFRRELRQAITTVSRPAIVFELPSTARLDATAIDCLIRCAREAAEHDAEIALVATNTEHQVLLDVTQISRVLAVFRSVEEAAAHLQQSRKALPHAAKVSDRI